MIWMISCETLLLHFSSFSFQKKKKKKEKKITPDNESDSETAAKDAPHHDGCLGLSFFICFLFLFAITRTPFPDSTMQCNEADYA